MVRLPPIAKRQCRTGDLKRQETGEGLPVL
jgi:hypothetical protein